MEKNRLEAFSDGVIAIIITITILELAQPLGDKMSDFLALAPTLLTYMLSFFFIAIYWVNHHAIFHDAKTINVKILWCNIVWLFVMSFIPFLTAWVGAYPYSFAPLVVYFADMSLACTAFHVMAYLIARENGEKLRFGLRSAASFIVYFGAAIFGGFCPIAAYISVAAVSCWWIFPQRKDSR